MIAQLPSLSRTRELPDHLSEAITEFLKVNGPRSMVEALDRPTYALPSSVIDAFANQVLRRAKRPVFLREQAETERAFTSLCESQKTIGFWQSKYILQTPLNRIERSLDESDLAFAGRDADWFAGIQEASKVVFRKLADMHEQMKAYIGYLLTSQVFISECRALEHAWRKLPREQRPEFPLRYAGHLSEGGADFDAFAVSLEKLLTKWNLYALATFDLPLPQGPLFPNLLPPGAAAAPRTGTSVYLPDYYRIGHDCELIQDIESAQLAAAREKQLDDSAATLRNPAAYARMLDVLHIERSIRARFGGKAPPGFVTVMVSAIATSLNCGVDHVHRCRKAIKKCLAGERATVPMLNRSDKSRVE